MLNDLLTNMNLRLKIVIIGPDCLASASWVESHGHILHIRLIAVEIRLISVGKIRQI